jgi:hypothetical protein
MTFSSIVGAKSSTGGGSGGIVEAMRTIAESETRKIHIAEFGIVKAVYPHSTASDTDNYECDIELKDKNVELKKVPVATQQIGLSNIPHRGDLVIVTFINGDINSPVIIGKLYNDADRPPLSKEEEVIYEPPYKKDNKLSRIQIMLPKKIVRLRFNDNRVRMAAGRSYMSANSVGELIIQSKKDKQGKQGTKINMTNDALVVDAVGSAGSCKIVMDSAGIKLETNFDVNIKCDGNLSVSATKDISMQGNNVSIIAKGSTSIKGTPVSIN